MNQETYKVKVCTPTSFYWITVRAWSASEAREKAIGFNGGKYGKYVGECVPVEKESA